MPSKWHAVSPSIWNRTMRGLSADAQRVDLYVRTCRVRIAEGLFELPLAYVAADLGLSIEQVEEALQELDNAGRLYVDLGAEVVLDPRGLQTLPITTERDNRITGAVSRFKAVPHTPLKATFLKLADQHSPPLANALREACDDFDLPAPEGPSHPPPEEGPSKDRRRSLEGPRRAGLGRAEKGRAGVGTSRTYEECYRCREKIPVVEGEPASSSNGQPMCLGCIPEGEAVA